MAARQHNVEQAGGLKRPRQPDVFTFRAAGRLERLTQSELDRYPGSLLHKTITDSSREGSDESRPLAVPDDAPHKVLAPMVFELFRGAEFGDALMTAARLNPEAFSPLSLADIQEALDSFWQLPPNLLRANLVSLISTVTAFLNDPNPDIKQFLASSPRVLGTLLKLPMAASACYTADQVLRALQRPPSYALLHGATYFVVKLRPSGPLLLPLCYVMEPDWDPDHPENDHELADLNNLQSDAKFLKRVHAAKNEGCAEESKRPIQCDARLVDEHGIDPDVLRAAHLLPEPGNIVEAPSVCPAVFPAFSDALKQELAAFGLHASWHSAWVLINAKGVHDCDVREGASAFLCVSWV